MSNQNWRNNRIQFPRLLAEIMGTVEFTTKQRQALCETMDLDWSDICELFDRADEEWQQIKDRIPA
jgi:hypothetical protein